MHRTRLRLLPHAYLLVTLLSLSGCGGGGGSDNGSPPDTTPPPTSNPPPTTNPPPATPRAGTPPTAQAGQYLVFQDRTKSVYKYDLDTDAVVRLWEPPDEDTRVHGLRISPDGQTISFGFSTFDGGGDILMASDGSGIRSLGGATGEWSPDDSKVAYLGYVRFIDSEDQSELFYPEVWIVDRDGKNRRKLSGPVPVAEEADDILHLKWSPDGRYVSWVLINDPGGWTSAPKNNAYALEIHDTQGASSNRQRILAPPAGRLDPNVREYQWAPDSSRLAFSADTADGSRVFTAMPDGTHVTQVSLPLRVGSMMSNFRWSPDSSRLACLAHTQDALELYSVAPDGTGTVKLNAPLTAGTTVNHDIVWAPDASRIAYAIRGLNFWDLPPELYTVRPDGSDRIQLNPPGANNIIDLFKWSPDSSRLAYRLGSQFRDRKLFTVGADGSDHFEVNGMLAADPLPDGKSHGTPLSQHFDWSPDSTHLFHVAENGTTASPAELFTLQADTKEYEKLNDPLTGAVSLEFAVFVWSKDGSRAAYVADDDGDGIQDLFLVAPNGAAYKNISKSFGLVGALEKFVWSP